MDNIEAFGDIRDEISSDHARPSDRTSPKYWEVSVEFPDDVDHVVGLDYEDIVIDAGSGKGLLVVQYAFQHKVARILGLENNEERYSIAKETEDKFRRLMESSNRGFSRFDFGKKDFMDEKCAGLFNMSTYVHAALMYSEGNVQFLSQLLEQRTPGFRITTNLEVLKFDDMGKSRVQIIRLDQNETPRYTSPSRDPRRVIEVSNTTQKKAFVPFYTYTIRSCDIGDKTPSSAARLRANMWVPIQVGKVWRTFVGVPTEIRQISQFSWSVT